MKCRFWGICLLLILLASCRSTKYVPENAYLLNKVTIKSTTKEVSVSELKSYLRQTPNTSVLGLWKLQLGVYNLSGPDTSKWVNRSLRKVGDEPVIYDHSLTELSTVQVKRALENKGYFEAEVINNVSFKKKKARVTYEIIPNQPYLLGKYNIKLPNDVLQDIATDSARSLIKPNMLFDGNVLNQERTRIANRMRGLGYYNFDKDFLHYIADSTLNSHKVNLTLSLRDYLNNTQDTISDYVFKPYYIKEVIIHTGYDPMNRAIDTPVDTIRQGKYLISYGRERDLRINTLINNCYIVPDHLYSDAAVERTYSALNSLEPTKYVSIVFEEVAPGWLSCYVVITPAKLKSFSVQGESTFSAGDWGVAGNIGYLHRNLFKGAESLSIQARTAYEWRDVGNTFEASAETILKFPVLLIPFTNTDFRKRVRANTEFNITYNYQKRPLEYSRTVAAAGIKYTWSQRNFRHSFDLVDLSYVYLPWISDEFRAQFINDESILKYSYEDHFIMRTGYSGSLSTYRSNQPLRNHYKVRYGIETAGNLLYGLNHLFNSTPSADETYKILNIRYSQYVKFDTDWVYHQIFDKNHRFVYHASLGLGIPYGNASSLPFEKRYYAGGANSVRGWGVRTLGPGIYKGTGKGIDFNNQSGDIKLDFNIELRSKLFWKIESALFLDAGNIWTIKDYESQPGGVFEFTKFYKQLALAYGVGVRLDLSFFILRADFGVKLFDPSQERRDQWRMKPTWANDMAFHFGIGYPF